jgi:hypothetical protein
MDIDDVQDTWDEAVEHIDTAIREKAVKEGITGFAVKKFKFKEFDI